MASVPAFDSVPDRLSEPEFWGLFGRVEHERLDFKRGVPDDILETIPAMAMTDGGLLVHGVDSHGRITGCPLSQNTQDRITRYANECDVTVRVRAVTVDGTELTVTSVPEIRDRVVTTPNGRLLRRVGGDCQPLRGDALTRFVKQRTERSGEEEFVPGFDPSMIDRRALDETLDADGRPKAGEADVVRALTGFGVAARTESRSAPSVMTAALVLFGDEPDSIVSGARVQLVRRAGTGPRPGPVSAREECTGPVGRILDCCLDFIAVHTSRHEAVIGKQRELLPEYPVAVLREAVLNALAHRDYGLVGATVDVTIWDDRIEVRSPGSLPGHITVENMRDEHYSRNPKIMRVLKIMGLVEEYGEGIDRMHSEMEARLMEPPIFDATPDSVTVTLRNKSLASAEDQAWLMMLGAEPLTADERRALLVARRERFVTPRRLKQFLGESDVSRLLSGAMDKGLLVRTGERGGSRYELSPEVVLRAGSTGIAARSRVKQTLIEEMQRRGSLSTAEGVELIGEPVATVRSLLNGLVEEGLARAEGQTRARRYYPI